jgi:hypothetical protein
MCVKTKSRRCETCRWSRVLTAMRQMRRCVECEMHKVTLALAAGAETGETPALPKRPLAEIWIGRLNWPNSNMFIRSASAGERECRKRLASFVAP